MWQVKFFSVGTHRPLPWATVSGLTREEAESRLQSPLVWPADAYPVLVLEYKGDGGLIDHPA